MLFLINDVVLDIDRPEEIIRSDEFPFSPAQFAKMYLAEILGLAKDEFFEDMQLPRSNPKRATQLAVLLAAKTGANSALIGPPQDGARKAEEMGVRLAEVSLMTISNLYQLQKGGNLTSAGVNKAVWASLTS